MVSKTSKAIKLVNILNWNIKVLKSNDYDIIKYINYP